MTVAVQYQYSERGVYGRKMPYVLKTGIVFSIYLWMSVSLIKVFQSFNENRYVTMYVTDNLFL